MAQERVGWPGIRPPLEASMCYFHSLHNPIIPIHHVIFPFFQLFRMKTFHLSMQSWKFVFRLPAVGEIRGEILFRSCILNSVQFLIPAIEGKGLLCCN
jgi:hypothetical protein